MSRPKSVRPCMWSYTPKREKIPGYFHQWVVSFFTTKPDGVVVSVHRGLLEDGDGQVHMVDPRNIQFMDVVDEQAATAGAEA